MTQLLPRALTGGVLCVIVSFGIARAAPGPNAVRFTFEGSLHVTVSAPRSQYVRGTVVPFTITMINQSESYSYPVRWACHQFAHLHFVSVSKVVSQTSQDLGPVPQLNKPATCETAVGVLRPGHKWTTQQEVRLVQPHVAARVVLIRKRTDQPGTFGMLAYMPVLNFTLKRRHGK